MSLYLTLKVAHILGATVLLGTGAGIAFFMLMAHRTGNARLVAHTAGVVVIADLLFTATAVVLQPITGAWLAILAGYRWTDAWVLATLARYLFTGACWLPVVWIQLRLRDLAGASVESGAPLPAAYHRLFRVWFALGVPAFSAVVAIIWLMTAKPTL